jgi:hypothetical protein
MRSKRLASSCYAGMIVVLAGVILIGCKSTQPPPATSSGTGSTYTSQTLAMSYTGALNASNQLMLGMLRLEGTENAITPEQAKALLPVLQLLQGQALKSDAERNAVWANIENQLAPAQLSAIANLRLTQDDLQTWMRDNSSGPGAVPMPGGAGSQGTPGAGPGPSGPRPQGTPGARPGQGSFGPQGTPGARPSLGTAGSIGGGSGQSDVLLSALVRLLASKSGDVPSPVGRVATPTPTKP